MEGFPFSGFESVQGRRPTMEDTHIVIDDLKKKYPDLGLKEEHYSVYGVFDGHGGPEASKLVKKMLHKNVLNDPAFAKGDIETALRNGFSKTDKEILSVSESDNWKSGSTAVLCLVINNSLYVANAGDSEAVLGRRTENGYEAVLLSEKHKPTEQGEKDRIKKAGGHVVFGRVMGSLAVARAFGDRDFKHPYNKAEDHFVTSEPFIRKIQLVPEEDEFLIVSCDGLWDRLTYQHAVEFVANARNEGRYPTETSQLLVKDSLDRGTLDNVTAIVIYFPTKSKGKPLNSIRSTQEEEEEDTDENQLDVYEYLQIEMERRKKLAEKEESSTSPEIGKKLNHFNLPSDEQVLDEFSCVLEKKLKYQGTLFITQNFLCFYASKLKRKITEQINMKDIQHIEKQKSKVVDNGIKITLKDGKKLFFNWKQNTQRDDAFGKLLEHYGKLEEEKEKQINNATTSDDKKKDEQKTTHKKKKHHKESEKSEKLDKSQEKPKEPDIQKEPSKEPETQKSLKASNLGNWSRFAD